MAEGSMLDGAAVDLVKSEPCILDAEASTVLQNGDSEDDTPLTAFKNEEVDAETSTDGPAPEAEVERNDYKDTLKLAVVKLERIDDKNSHLHKLFEKYTTTEMSKNIIDIDNNITNPPSLDEKLEESNDEMSHVTDDLKAHSDNDSKTDVMYGCDEQDIHSLKLAVVKLERIDDKASQLYKLFEKYKNKNAFNVDSTRKTKIDSIDSSEDDKIFVKHDISTDKDFDSKKNVQNKCDECGVTYKLKNSLLAHKRKQCFGKRPRARLPPIIKTSYECAICQEKFYNILTFINHTRSHTGGKRYECHVCEKGYNNRSRWVIHLRTHTGHRPYSCDQCGKTFREKSGLRLHKKTHVKERIYECDLCNQKFVTKASVKRHLYRVHPSVTSIQCDLCKKHFKIRESLIKHMEIHAGKYQCSVCQKCLSSKNDLKSHMYIHEDVKPYKCKMCDNAFRRADCLKRHIMKAHTGERPYPCTLCDKGYVTRGGLTQHMRSHTGERPYKCDVCNIYSSYKHDHSEESQHLHQCNVCKRFYTKSSLKTHMRNKHSEIRYHCDVCKKEYCSNDRFIIHMRTHTGEKPFQCDVCKKCYKEKRTLQKHMHIHVGDLLVECHICKKKISHTHLKIHIMRIHNGIKPFKCEVCSQTFGYQRGLDKHVCSRNKDRLFECEICNKMFNRKDSFESHCRRQHLSERMYQCDICKRSFRGKISIVNHLRGHANHLK